MKNVNILKALIIITFVIIPRAFSIIEISKDTVFVNDINFSSCDIYSTSIDTIKIWNCVDSQVTLDTVEIRINPLHNSLFKVTDCNIIYYDSCLSSIDIAILYKIPFSTGKDTLIWVKTGIIDYPFLNYSPFNQLRIPAAYISFYNFISRLSFNGIDTCYIYSILLTPCFNCSSRQLFIIDFSAQITLYYSDGSRVSFVAINDYSSRVSATTGYRIYNRPNTSDPGIFKINGQRLPFFSGKYSPGLYLRMINKGSIEKTIEGRSGKFCNSWKEGAASPAVSK